MGYSITFARAAERQFRNLTANVQARLQPRIDALADDPRPRGAERLAVARVSTGSVLATTA